MKLPKRILTLTQEMVTAELVAARLLRTFHPADVSQRFMAGNEIARIYGWYRCSRNFHLGLWGVFARFKHAAFGWRSYWIRADSVKQLQDRGLVGLSNRRCVFITVLGADFVRETLTKERNERKASPEYKKQRALRQSQYRASYRASYQRRQAQKLRTALR